MVLTLAAHTRPMQAPDVHTGIPGYVWAAVVIVAAVAALGVALAIRSRRKDRAQRVRHALDRAHRQARLAEIVRTAPPLTVLVPPADATPAIDLDTPTRVIPLPPVKPRGGRHAKASLIGRARVPLDLSRLLPGRSGGWRA